MSCPEPVPIHPTREPDPRTGTIILATYMRLSSRLTTPLEEFLVAGCGFRGVSTCYLYNRDQNHSHLTNYPSLASFGLAPEKMQPQLQLVQHYTVRLGKTPHHDQPLLIHPRELESFLSGGFPVLPYVAIPGPFCAAPAARVSLCEVFAVNAPKPRPLCF